MELLVDIALEAHGLHALNVSGPGPEPDAVQHVRNALFVVGEGGRGRRHRRPSAYCANN